MLIYLQFLKGRLGKGFYVMLVGLILFDETRKVDMVMGISLVLVGLFNLIVGCMRENYDDFNDDYQEKGNNEQSHHREEREIYED